MAGIGAVGAYNYSGAYWYGYTQRASSAGAAEPAKAAATQPAPGAAPAVRAGAATPAARAGQPESTEDMLKRYDSDPVGMAVRQRIQFPGAELPGTAEDGQEVKSAAEVMEEGECQTCASRKYQDGSDDPGVSFKTAAHIDPDNAASVVRGHEMEHVVREQAKAEREDRKVVQQSVTLHTDICPECGKVFVSGGTTRTTTKSDNSDELAQQQQQKIGQGKPAAA